MANYQAFILSLTALFFLAFCLWLLYRGRSGQGGGQPAPGDQDGQGWKFSELIQIVSMLVLQAEQTIPRETGTQKLQWVLDRCDEIGITKLIPKQVISAIIESTVYAVKRQPPPASVVTGADSPQPKSDPTVARAASDDAGSGEASQPGSASAPTFGAVDAMLHAGYFGPRAKRAKRARVPALAVDAIEYDGQPGSGGIPVADL